MLERLFSSKARVAVLGNLLLHPERAFHARELERIVGPGSYHSAWKELKNAESLGIATSHRVGRTLRYQVNPESPLVADLTRLFRTADVTVTPALAIAETESPRYAAVSGTLPRDGIGTSAHVRTQVPALLRRKRSHILRAASRWGASNVRVFGSFARGDAGAASDFDFLVSLEPGRSLLDLGGLLSELEGLLGRPVDVVTDAGLRGRIRDRVLREAVPL